MRGRLLWKLLAINIPVLMVMMGVVWMAIDNYAADYFAVLMKKYHVSPTETHQMFIESVHQYIIQAGVVGLCLAGLMSYVLTKRVLRPLSEMMEATQKMAKGDYSGRVTATTNDEIGQLGNVFNQLGSNLAQIEQLRKNMVIDIAHDFRTPLTNIRGYLEGISDGVVAPSKEVLTLVQEETLRLVRLIEELQQLTHADAAKVFLNREEVFLPNLITRVQDLYQPEFQAKSIEVDMRLQEDVAVMMGDPDRLIQAVGNLIQNASQYTPSGGNVRISLNQTLEGIRFMVANTGNGIDTKDLPFIFERFYRADKSRARESGGAGVGLAIVKGIIEAHGGTVGAKSQDGRTWIWFTLPAEDVKRNA